MKAEGRQNDEPSETEIKLNNQQLTRKLKALAAANSRAFHIRMEIEAHCIEVYGVDPSDIDCDVFIDLVDGATGACGGMTAAEFDASMTEAIMRHKKA